MINCTSDERDIIHFEIIHNVFRCCNLSLNFIIQKPRTSARKTLIHRTRRKTYVSNTPLSVSCNGGSCNYLHRFHTTLKTHTRKRHHRLNEHSQWTSSTLGIQMQSYLLGQWLLAVSIRPSTKRLLYDVLSLITACLCLSTMECDYMFHYQLLIQWMFYIWNIVRSGNSPTSCIGTSMETRLFLQQLSVGRLHQR